MTKITISKLPNGKNTIIYENEISDERMDMIRKKIAKIKSDKKERIQKMFDKIPDINWDILKYANNNDKDAVLLRYPEHEIFINSIK